LKIYNQLGQVVKTLINDQVMTKGTYEMIWDGKNDAGKPVSSGIYIAQLRFGNFSKEIKMMLVK
jgi:flagellar hook assembly protein FlgD